jgi:inhibitor of KinA
LTPGAGCAKHCGMTAFPDIAPLGADGLIVRFGDRLDDAANRAAIAFRAHAEAQGWAGLVETVPSLASVLLRYDPGATDRAAVAAAARAAIAVQDWYAAPMPSGRRLWRIPTAYGGDLGPQLAEAAAAAGVSPEQAMAELGTARVRVLAIGFAPGQPYAGMLPEHWNIPRLKEITPRIPQGALVVAVRQLIVFTADTPTGWRHIGQTAFRTFRPGAAEPFPLRAGDELVFEPVSADTLRTLRAGDDGGQGGARVEVIG